MAQKENIKFISSDILEGMTSISALLNSCCGNDRKIEKIIIDRTRRRAKKSEIGYLTAKSHELGFPIEFTDAETVEKNAIGNSHGGILAFCTNRHLPELTAEHIEPSRLYVYLEGIEDPYNFGYAVRSLYAAGCAGIVLPRRNWMNSSGVVARASAGASERIPIFVSDSENTVNCFHNAGYQIICAGIRNSVSLYDSDLTLKYPILLVIGGEKRGISRNILESADKIVRIDYGRDFHGSLSAAGAAAVMAFEILRQNKEEK